MLYEVITPLAEPQYVEAVRMTDLRPAEAYEPGNTMIALACRFGKARLIDNIRF